MSRFSDFQARYLAGELTAADFEGMSPEDSVKARVEAGELHRSGFGEIQRAGTSDKRSHHFVLSSERACGPYKDVVRFSAWDTDDFVKQGSTLLWAHDGSQPPLGKVDKVAKIKTRKTLEGVVRFMDEGIYPFADLIARMVEADVITNGSVGFQITDARPPTGAELKKERLSQHSMIIEGAVLREFSIVPVGADPNAIKLRGDAIRSELDDLVERGETDRELANHFIELLNLYEPLAARSIIVPEFSWRTAEAPQEPVEAPEPEAEEVQKDDSQERTDEFAERVEAIAQRIEDLAESRADQASTIEDLTARLREAEATIERLEAGLTEANERMQTLSEGLYVAQGPLDIKPQERTSSVPVYAGLLDGIYDLEK